MRSVHLPLGPLLLTKDKWSDDFFFLQFHLLSIALSNLIFSTTLPKSVITWKDLLCIIVLPIHTHPVASQRELNIKQKTKRV